MDSRDSYKMPAELKLIPVSDAYEDLLRRTLSRIPSDLARLIFLGSTRDYNSGTYYHDGLASRFSSEKASQALELAHAETFKQLAAYSLEAWVKEIEIYAYTSRQSAETITHTWQALEPYRVAVPMRQNPTVVQLFISNLRIALAILRNRQNLEAADPSASSRLQSPDQ